MEKNWCDNHSGNATASFECNDTHPLRFKALFEVADNYYHAKDYKSAKSGYKNFLEYCSNQVNCNIGR